MRWSPWSRSLEVGPQYSSLGSQPILCASILGLVPKQLHFCRNYVEIMPSMAEGIKIGIQECQHQFQGRRWNCTTVYDSLAILGPCWTKREQALGSFPLTLGEDGLRLEQD
ncbi:Protein Wnt-3a [Saguinus oedipus]|uniref:Protein Wnt n=1 Tax=Saguinus oedipus TaxID=9490 RepID=A0ABQ9WDC7_SAGOE|nr:Protein Wnt-3a [Saguinus oedipus]